MLVVGVGWVETPIGSVPVAWINQFFVGFRRVHKCEIIRPQITIRLNHIGVTPKLDSVAKRPV